MVRVDAMQLRVKRDEVRVGDVLLDAFGGDAGRYACSKEWPGTVGEHVRVTNIDSLYIKAGGHFGAIYTEFLVERPDGKQCEHKTTCPAEPKRHVTQADGMTGAECYRRYCENMREGKHKLTRAQKTLAQEIWRVELLKKTREQEILDKSRAVTVVVETEDE
jgi:hypothetical protein